MEVEALFNFDNIECEMLDCVGMHIGIGSFAATTHTCIHTVMYIHMHTCVCTTGVDPNTLVILQGRMLAEHCCQRSAS